MGLIDYETYRSQIERLYEGRCSILHYVQNKDPVSKITSGAWETIAEDIPCYLEVENAPIASGDIAGVQQTNTLILAPDVVVSDGSRVVVTQHGVTATYTSTGKPIVLGSHQEIALEVNEFARDGKR